MPPAWVQLAQALSFFALSFASEDAAVFGAAALVGLRKLEWSVGLSAVFVGIWCGDLVLYGLARRYGKALLRRFAQGGRLAGGEAWFAKSGWSALCLSRFVPGLRLPTVIAAGLSEASVRVFVTISAMSALIWVGAIIGGAALLSETRALRLTQEIHDVRWFAGLTVGVLFLRPMLCRGPDLKAVCIWRRFTAFVERVRRWEFWPGWIFYAPVVLYYVWLGVRFRGFGLPAIANPGLSRGGLVGESKHEAVRLLRVAAPEQNADGWVILPGEIAARLHEFDRIYHGQALAYPLILKPDIGQRGAGVRVIRNREAAAAYLAALPAAILLQTYAPGPREIGVFYYRFPHETKGRIFAITQKIFPSIMGDGHRTLAEMILTHPRARLIAEIYLERFAARKHDVLAAGERLQLVEAGNHAQGSIFRDGMHLRTPALEAAIDAISQRIPGFFIGRYDIRYGREEDLNAGRFAIVELNGSGAEATSIYDERNSLWAAYRTLFRQWRLVFEIGAANRALGAVAPGLLSLLLAWAENSALVATYPIAD